MPMIAPSSLDARLAHARVLFARDEVAQAETVLRALAAEAPAREDVAMLLAEVLRSGGRLGAAAEAVLVLARANGFQPRVALRAAAFARACDRHPVAAEICAAALARSPRDPELLVLAGHAAREMGDFATARSRYLAALDAGVDPDRHHVLGALVNTRRYSDGADPDRARCEAQWRDPQRSLQARASAGHALAKILDDVGDYATAAGVLRAANRDERALQPWDVDAWQRFVAARSRERVAPAAVADPDFVPVFVVGVPRSGTTLTASRLARATGARDRGELRVLRFVADKLRAGGRLGDRLAIAEAADLYRRLTRQDDEPSRIYIDQDPLNFRWLDVAFAMFPQARVIHVRRDVRDTALSLWSQSFAHPDMAFSHDFGDMGTFVQGHDELMRHWRGCFGAAIRDVDYEALVADPDGVVAGLAAFIGGRSPDVVDTADAPVLSASVWQARQPVYASSVGRWTRYAPYVPELAQLEPPASGMQAPKGRG